MTCAANEIQLTFSQNLFGSATSSFTDGGCNPTLNNGQWTVNAGLGQCGMQVGSGMFDPNGTGATQHMTFDYTIAAARGVLAFSGTSGLHGVVGLAIPASVEFQCRYASGVTLTSAQFEVKDTSVSDQTFAYGALDNNFSLKLFEDDTFSTERGSSIFIGSTVYTAATFGLTALSSHIEFFIESCALKVTTNSIDIISSNCYSRALSCKMENVDGNHVQTTSSRFSFLAFALTNQAEGVSNVMECNLRICDKAGSGCTISQTCPANTNGYDYTLNGQ